MYWQSPRKSLLFLKEMGKLSVALFLMLHYLDLRVVLISLVWLVFLQRSRFFFLIIRVCLSYSKKVLSWVGALLLRIVRLQKYAAKMEYSFPLEQLSEELAKESNEFARYIFSPYVTKRPDADGTNMEEQETKHHPGLAFLSRLPLMMRPEGRIKSSAPPEKKPKTKLD